MQSNFTVSMPFIFAEEGGYVNNKKDPGGITNLGVTKATWEQYIGHKVTAEDMAKLTQAQVTPLYKRNYWDAVHGNDLPAGLDYAVFDFSVNSGAGRAVRFLQKMLRVEQDGIVGYETLEAIKAAPLNQLIDDYIDAREKWLKSLSTFKTFGHGWLARTARVRTRAHKLAGNVELPAPPAELPETAKALQSDVKIPEVLKSPEGLASVGGVLGAVGGLVSSSPVLAYAIAGILVLGLGVGLWLLVAKARSS